MKPTLKEIQSCKTCELCLNHSTNRAFTTNHSQQDKNPHMLDSTYKAEGFRSRGYMDDNDKEKNIVDTRPADTIQSENSEDTP